MQCAAQNSMTASSEDTQGIVGLIPSSQLESSI